MSHDRYIHARPIITTVQVTLGQACIDKRGISVNVMGAWVKILRLELVSDFMDRVFSYIDLSKCNIFIDGDECLVKNLTRVYLRGGEHIMIVPNNFNPRANPALTRSEDATAFRTTRASRPQNRDQKSVRCNTKAQSPII